MTDFLGPEDINEREREHTPSPAESFVRQAMLLSFAACLMALVLPTLAELELVVNANMPLAADAAVPFYDPRIGGGSMLDRAGTGVGEPLNVSPPLCTIMPAQTVLPLQGHHLRAEFARGIDREWVLPVCTSSGLVSTSGVPSVHSR